MFNVRNIEFFRYYIFFGFLTRLHDVTSQSLVICTLGNNTFDVITACENITLKSAENILKRGYRVLNGLTLNVEFILREVGFLIF